MNQRSKRARDRKHQDVGASTFQTGGHIASHRRGAAPVVRTPQKATGDVPASKMSGAAKASPFFKRLKEILPGSKTEEQKIIAQATEKTDEVDSGSDTDTTEDSKDTE